MFNPHTKKKKKKTEQTKDEEKINDKDEKPAL